MYILFEGRLDTVSVYKFMLCNVGFWLWSRNAKKTYLSDYINYFKNTAEILNNATQEGGQTQLITGEFGMTWYTGKFIYLNNAYWQKNYSIVLDYLKDNAVLLVIGIYLSEHIEVSNLIFMFLSFPSKNRI